MAKAELPNSVLSDLPAGNIWKFSERNDELRPNLNGGLTELTDLSKATETVNGVVDLLKDRYVQSEWQFAAVLGEDWYLAVVFTHPAKTGLTTIRPSVADNFLKPDVFGDHKNLSDVSFVDQNPLNEKLAASHRWAYNAYGGFNRYKLMVPRGILRRPHETTVYQSGVAYIEMNLHSIDDEIMVIKEALWSNRQVTRRSSIIKNAPLRSALKRVLQIQTSAPSEPKPFWS